MAAGTGHRRIDARTPDLGAAGLILSLILVLASALRLIHLGRLGLWLDEIYSMEMTRGSLVETVRAVAHDVHPPLYFLVLNIWAPLAGHSETLLRLPSALCGVAAVYVTWRLAIRVLSCRAALTASLFTAVSTMALYYSQELRSYALLHLLSVATCDRALSWYQRRRLLDAAAFAITATLLLYTHYFGALVLTALDIWMLARLWQDKTTATAEGQLSPQRDWRGIQVFLCIQFVAVLLFAPWLPVLAQQRIAVERQFWLGRPTLTSLWTTLSIFAGLARPDWGGSKMSYREFSIGVALALPLALGFQTWTSKLDPCSSPGLRRPDGTHVAGPWVWALFACWLLLPAAIAYLASQGATHIYNYRNLIVSLPAWCLCLSAILDRQSNPRLRAILMALVIAPSISGAFWNYTDPHKEQWRELALQLRAGLQPNDFLSIEEPWLGVAVHYYLGEVPYRPLERPTPPTLTQVRRLWLVRGPAGRRPDHVEWVNNELARLQMNGFRVILIRRFVGADLILLDK